MPENFTPEQQAAVGLIGDICRGEYGRLPDSLVEMFDDLAALYHGRWPAYEPCLVGYHTLGHVFDVALALARMVAGWNKVNQKARLSEEHFLLAMAAAFFHDSGYLKDKGDTEGLGGKFTFTHVERSMDLARSYLNDKGWPEDAVQMVALIISQTEFHREPEISSLFNDPLEEAVANMVATADLIAQMADFEYMQRINYLFDEFREGYKVEGGKSLTERGVRVFGSVAEMVENTAGFYEEFVQPRLALLGHMDDYLVAFFGEDRNPYLENIAANLSGKLVESRVQWRRLGEVLEKYGGVSAEHIQEAVKRQKKQEKSDSFSGNKQPIGGLCRNLLARINQKNSSERLGEILMEMGAIDPVTLCQGLLAQTLPPDLLAKLSHEELIFLLNVSMLLQNYQKGSQVLNHVLEMTNRMLNCEASSILLADHDTGEIVIALPTGPQGSTIEGRRMPMNMGLGGWVYRHGQPVSLKNATQDKRFDKGLDDITNFRTRSILAVPLHINGEWIGAIEMLNKKDDNFTEHDMDVLTSLVNVLGSALGVAMACGTEYPAGSSEIT